ncbi:(d)CMP kinase [Desulfopila sp. IMCC35008]|uniref:(d)CMP kinase n=1 Tax=Desulfopila sp. IMCC35008 TaxID=2653858 RepID=UPI0013D8A8B0|nr:(d)CMP kinase [Desulfopila sp. IMCC35008]
MSDLQDIVTIDGPSGVGKSTISRRTAAALGFTYLDTGAMYRAVAWFLESEQVDVTDETAVQKSLESLEIELLPAADEMSDVGVRVAGKDVSREIRMPEMSMAASRVSALNVVRKRLTAMQQEIGRRGKIVAEGRDTGTVVFPDAAYKFYLDADPGERARRRVAQLREKGEVQDEAEVLAMILERDKNDSERELAPLAVAADAVVIDTTKISINEVGRAILDSIRKKKG